MIAAERYRRIWRTVARIPRGRVATYGQIADLAGLGRGARLVGRALRCLPPDSGVPWHRVVNASGRISLPPGSEARERQQALLAAEDVAVVGGRIDLGRYRWASLDEVLWRPD